jgi:hypothetical protein
VRADNDGFVSDNDGSVSDNDCCADYHDYDDYYDNNYDTCASCLPGR